MAVGRSGDVIERNFVWTDNFGRWEIAFRISRIEPLFDFG